jgi:transcriptional antiterminator RfaH
MRKTLCGLLRDTSAAGYSHDEYTFARRRSGMSFWACAQLDQRRERLALYCLGLAGHAVYQPRIRAPHRTSVALFPSYLFVAIEAQWHAVRWSPGISKVLMNGEEPARVPDRVIEELRAREGRNGLIVLPPPSRGYNGAQFRPGDKVRISAGPLSGFVGLVAGMKGRQRVEILLQLLGRVEIAAAAVERA